MEEYILKALKDSDMKVKSVVISNEKSKYGLLHESVKKLTVFTDEGILPLVMKTVNRTHTPEQLFKMLYRECEDEEHKVDLERFGAYCHYLSMKQMPEREEFFYRNIPEIIKKFIPMIWGCFEQKDKIIFIMEDLSNCINMDKIDVPESWNKQHLLLAMHDMAVIHYGLSSLMNPLKDKFFCSVDYSSIMKFLWEFHDTVTMGCGIKVEHKVYEAGKTFILHIEDIERVLSSYETVIHNDFNIRNICISETGENLKVYDWEFLNIGNPMFDVLDLLLSISSEYINREAIYHMVCEYTLCCKKMGIIEVKPLTYMKLLYFCSMKYAATRMNMYLLCYRQKKHKYIERMYHNLKLILELYESEERIFDGEKWKL